MLEVFYALSAEGLKTNAFVKAQVKLVAMN